MSSPQLDRKLWEQLQCALEQTQSLIRHIKDSQQAAWATSDESSSATHLEELCRGAETRAGQEIAKLRAVQQEIEQLRSRNEASLREVQRLAYQDPLTGLANLNLLREHLQTLPGADIPQPQTVLFILDIDRFYEMNHLLGVEAGDAILMRLAERLTQMAGPDEVLARRSEDEFVLVVTGVELKRLPTAVSELTHRIMSLVGQPFLFEGQKFEITASIGASHYPDAAKSPEELLGQAARALSVAKRRGRSQVQLYDSSLGAQVRREARIEFEMRNALECGEFAICYLPVVAFEEKAGCLQGRLIGIEALLRWNHRTEGILNPEAFLPLAESNGFIVSLGRWVLESVCRQLEKWGSSGLSLYVSVNLSGRELLQLGLTEAVCELIDKYRISRQSLIFEFGEDWSSLDEEHIDQSIANLKEEGFSLAVDRFGSRHSSPRRLTLARFLKLSRHLLEDGHSSHLRAALAVAEGLGLSPIAVGVETQEQLVTAFQSGCNLFQGHLLSSAIPAEEIPKLAREPWVYPIRFAD